MENRPFMRRFLKSFCLIVDMGRIELSSFAASSAFFLFLSLIPILLLFVPLGIFLPLLWKRFKNPFRTVFFGLLVSAAIEFLQLFTLRATDINDLMTNTSGALMGWIIGRIAVCFYSVPGSSERKRDVYQVIGIAFSVMFFLQISQDVLT